MREGLVAIFDVGKTNTKVALVNRSDGEVAWTRSRFTPSGPSEPYRHFDVAALEAFLLESLAEAPHKSAVTAIMPVTHGACAALVTDDGLALPVMDYEDPQVEEISRAYEAERDPFADTLSPALPLGLNLARQLFWLENRFPEAFARATHLLMYPQYWSWRLSGVPASEVTSLGTHTDLWRPNAAGPSAFAVARGYARRMPPLRGAAEVLGQLRPEIARRTGLPAATQVLCGIHDSNASYIRHRLARPTGEPFSVVSTGTWSIVMSNGADLRRLDERRDMLANVNALGEPVATARFMGGREHDHIVAGDTGPGWDAGGALEGLIDRGIMALPSFTATGGPFQGRCGRIVGEELLEPGQRGALAGLYLALMTDHVLDLLGARGDIIVEGPQAENATFLGGLAALREGSTVLRSSDRTGTLGGVLALMDGPGLGEALRPCEPLIGGALHRYRDLWREAVADSRETDRVA
ncbi:MAG TPA: FGGY family carbohydrate kinase [Microvirga sp.]|jgi:sugar (pentulose or hexulose) kinase|nr:FGGY family carbohydrate kinase [Microvirga sp.]